MRQSRASVTVPGICIQRFGKQFIGGVYNLQGLLKINRYTQSHHEYVTL